MSDYLLRRTEVGMYVVHAGDDPKAWLCPAENPNWWYGRQIDAPATRQICMPHDGSIEAEGEAAKRVAAILLRPLWTPWPRGLTAHAPGPRLQLCKRGST
ncbi:hypothetical protein AB0L06_32415 [Spirillospora sp. NPDC052269]